MKSKHLFLIKTFVACFFSELIFAQIPNWEWALRAGDHFHDDGRSVSTDAGGNVYVTGSFQGPSITFGSISLFNPYDIPEIFIVKYNSSGAVLWAKHPGGGNHLSEGSCISTDVNGNVYVTGYFSRTITFGSTTLISNNSTHDIFVAKYNASGNVLWARSAGGRGSDNCNGISLDSSGNIYVTGNFESDSITFGSILLINDTSNTPDIFITKYDDSGNALWAKSASGTGIKMSNGISTDIGGNSYVTGTFSRNSITFGSTTLINDSGYYTDIFITKYDSSGNILWAKSAGATGFEKSNSITTDISGNVYVAGYFENDTIVFGLDTLINADTTGIGSTPLPDIFIAKYDASGNVLWAQRAGGINGDECNNIRTDISGNMYLIGNFCSDSLTFNNITLTNPSGCIIFIAKYNASGNALWAERAGGNDGDIGSGISADGSGNVYITGKYYSPVITFGNTNLTLTNYSYSNWTDFFIAKLSQGTVSTNDLFVNENELKVYPNPASHKITLKFDDLRSNYIEIKIFDILGKIVFSHPYDAMNDPIEIDISGFNEGIFMINIQSTEFSRTEKIIVTK